MEDRKKFYEMTKPIKFRKLKQAKLMTVHWCKAQRERIVYHYYYTMYKVNILQRYYYRDSVETPYRSELIPQNAPKVCSPYFRAKVKMGIVQEECIHQDYFYKLNKDGTKKIVYVVKNDVDFRLFFDSCLEDIEINIGDNWYLTEKMPTLKVCMGYNFNSTEGTVEYDTMEFNLSPLRELKLRDSLGKIRIQDVSVSMCKYYYELACRQFEKKLNTMSLNDLSFTHKDESRKVKDFI